MGARRVPNPVEGLGSLAIWTLIAGAGGCGAPGSRVSLEAQRYRLEVTLDPATHRLDGRATIEATVQEGPLLSDRAKPVCRLRIHPDLSISRVTMNGRRLLVRPVRVSTPTAVHNVAVSSTTSEARWTVYDVHLDQPAPTVALHVDYGGTLFQNVEAGEKPGRIHNFEVRAHVAREGVHLSDGCWYPTPDTVHARPADFILLVDPVVGLEFQASAERDPSLSSQTGRSAWRTHDPIDTLTLVGGPWITFERARGPQTLRVQVRAERADRHGPLLDALVRILDRYEPLLGPYPARELTIVENFFSSGFAYPGFILFGPAVFEMGERAWSTHGYLDHEVLHGWWGNGVLVDPADGNWSEPLASYGANYYGFVLDGEESEARRKRRNFSHFLSQTSTLNERALGSFGLDDGCSRAVAYQKGAAVLHMLARELGEGRFWCALRELASTRMGRRATWSDIKAVCEGESDGTLDWFFDQWIRRPGAPEVHGERAEYRSGEDRLLLTIRQKEPAYRLNLPIRILGTDRTIDTAVPLRNLDQQFEFSLDGTVPIAVVLDPDHHVFRWVPPDERIPTTATTRGGSSLITVLPDRPVSSIYRNVQQVFDPEDASADRLERQAEALRAGDLSDQSVLILGDAVFDPYVSGFLTAVGFPVRFDESGFEFDGTRYDDPSDAVLATAHHPGAHAGAITVVYGRQPEAIPRPVTLTFYEHSVVVFRDGRPIVRKDLEPSRSLPVTTR